MKQGMSLVICVCMIAAATAWFGTRGDTAPQSETTQVKQLRQQIGALRQAASLTACKGPGVVVHLEDNPQASQPKSSENTTEPDPQFQPNIIHDFDLLQVVNDLRSQMAEAISVNGVRVSSYSSIRCVGPDIYIGPKIISHPYKVEAIGDSDALFQILSRDGGLLENLRSLGVRARVVKTNVLHLKAATDTPTFRYGKAE